MSEVHSRESSVPDRKLVAVGESYLRPADLRRRHSTGTPGVSFRLRRDGGKSYAVRLAGRWVTTQGGLREARALKAQTDARKAQGLRVVLPTRRTFSEAGEAWYEEAKRRLRDGTLRDYRADLDRLIDRWGAQQVASITPEDIASLIEELEGDGLSASRISNRLKPAVGTFGHAVFRGWITVSPWSQLPRGYRPNCNATREHREWTAADVVKVIAASEELDARPESHLAYTPIIRFLLATGCRLGETLGAQWGDLDLKSGLFTVSRSFTRDSKIGAPKTKSSLRRVPLTDDAVAFLKAHRASAWENVIPPASAFVFAGRQGLPPSQSNFRRRGWDPAIRKAGLTDGPRVTPHDCRHAVASLLRAQGISSSVAADVLGHSTSAITERVYGHAWNREEREESVRQAITTGMKGAS